MSETGDELDETDDELPIDEEKDEDLEEVNEETDTKSPLDWDYEDPNAESTEDYTVDWDKIVSKDDELDNDNENFQENQDSQSTVLISEKRDDELEEEDLEEEHEDGETQSEEEYSDEIEELTDSELIEELWQKFDELEREGMSPDEISDIMQKAEETYEALKEEAELREKEHQDKLEQANHSNEEKAEDYPTEILDSDKAQEVLDTVEKLADEEKSEEEIVEELEFPEEKEVSSEDQHDEEVEAENKEVIGNPAQFQEYIEIITDLVDEGKSVDEIVEILEKEDETERFKEYLEKLCEKEEQETLRQVNHSDEEELEDYGEVIDNPHAVQEIVDEVDNLVEKGKSDDEIKEEFKEKEEHERLSEQVKKIREKEEQETLRQVNHSDEEELEAHGEVIDNPHAVQEIVDEVDDLVEKGKSDDEIKDEFKEKEAHERLSEQVKKIREKEEQENLRQVNHSDEEELEDYGEVIDNPTEMQKIIDNIEKTVDKERSEENLVDKSNEKRTLDKFVELVKDLLEQEVEENIRRVDHSDEEKDDLPPRITSQKVIEQFMAKFYEEDEEQREKEENQEITRVQDKRLIEDDEPDEIEEKVELVENNGLVSLQVIRGESKEAEKSEDDVELPEEKVETLEDEEFEKLKELYKKDTGKRPIYAGKETKGFSKWLEELVEESQELVEQIREEEEEEWQKTLRKWFNEVPEEINSELKKILMDIIHDPDFYERMRNFLSEYSKIIEKLEKGTLSDEEREIFMNKLKDLMNTSQIHLNLYENIRAFKEYFFKHSVWNPHRISHIKEDFLSRLSQKYKILKKVDGKQIKSINIDPLLTRSFSTNYELPELRKKINKKILSLIWKELRNSGVTLQYLNKKLGLTFKTLRYSGHSISNDTYEILNNIIKSKFTPDTIHDLFGQNFIPYKITIGKSGKEIKVLDDNDLTDEFLAIMSGDGSLLPNGQSFSVALNSVDEERYVQYVKNLMETLFPKAVIHKVEREGKGIVLQINDISYHYALVCKGLIPGDKVKNQIRVLKKNLENHTNLNKWLKGLFDTDGTVYVKRRGMSIILGFSSGSKPLVDDFKSICETLGIEPSPTISVGKYKNETTAKESTVYTTNIYKKESIKKFIEIVDPEKFKEPMRRLYIASKLILRRSPKIIRQDVEDRLKTLVPDKRKRRYSKQYALLLKKTIEESYKENFNKNEFVINKEMIEKALNDVTKENALSHNIKIENRKIRRFPSELRNQICELISKIIDVKITDEEEILETLLNFFGDSKEGKMYELNELLNDIITRKILKQYISKLIGLVRVIKRQSELGDLHVYTISRDFEINHKILISIIKDLKQKKYIRYDKPVVQKNPSKTPTVLYMENKTIIDSYIINLRNKGLTYREISKETSKKFKFNITYWRVSKIIEEDLSKGN